MSDRGSTHSPGPVFRNDPEKVGKEDESPFVGLLQVEAA
jgi:hypothetical protein